MHSMTVSLTDIWTNTGTDVWTDVSTTLPAEPRTASEALTLANVQARAERLFEDGYVARAIAPHRLAMTTPRGAIYELTERSCPCPFFVKHAGRCSCKHLLGAARLLKKQAAVLRHNALMWEAFL